jgi:hypothetical protein
VLVVDDAILVCVYESIGVGAPGGVREIERNEHVVGEV